MALHSATFQMADRLADGNLVDVLVAHHAQGCSWEEVARRLYADYGIHVTGQTLRRWAVKLGIGVAA